MSIAKLVVSEVRTVNIDVGNIDAATNIRLMKDIFGRTRMDICPLAFAVTVVEKLMYENCSTIDDIKVMRDVYPIVVKQFGKSLNTTATNIERLARRCWDKMIANSTVLFYLGRHITRRPTTKQLLCYLAVFSHTGCTYFSENNLRDDAIKRNKSEREDTNPNKPMMLVISTFEDFRGSLAIPYDQSINFNVRQINQGYSKIAFTLRGLHFQEGEYAQAKLVSCLHGAIFNVAVDLRKGETFGHAYSAVLSFENRKQMYIPRGFAHGYLTLEDDTLMQWCVDNDFCGESAKAVRYDSDFIWEGEPWPEGEYIISDKDRNAMKLEKLYNL